MMLFNENKQCIGEFKSLVKPDGWIIGKDVQDFHNSNNSNISLENCDKYGLKPASTLALFNYWGSRADKLIAHNLKFDLARIEYLSNRLAIRLNLPPLRACTMELSTDIIKIPPTDRMIEFGHGEKFKNPNLKETYKFFFNEEFEGAHDAMADVKACARIYFEGILA